MITVVTTVKIATIFRIVNPFLVFRLIDDQVVSFFI
jgi:hypothetical protein